MRKIDCVLFCFILVPLYSFAQTQQGFVKTRGKMNAEGELVPGERVPGVTLVFNTKATHVSDSNGNFSLHVPSKTFSLVGASKQGYSLVDADALRRQNSFSARNPFVVVMEDEAQHRQDIKEAADKVRRTLKREIRRREDELDAMREENAITQGRYDSLRLEFARYRQSSEALVNEMAERFASIDYDCLNEFNRQVQMYIENGELVKADSLINTKGSIENRYNRIREQMENNAEREKELRIQQKKLALSKQLTAREKEDLMNDLYAKHTIYLQHYQQDSALYCLKMRMNLDTADMRALWEYSVLADEQKDYKEALDGYTRFYSRIKKTDDLYRLHGVANNLGNLYSFINQFSKSEEILLEAYDCSKKLFDENPEYRYILAKTENNLGNFYFVTRNFKNSESYYLKALDNDTILFEQDPDRYMKELGKVLNNLGNLYHTVKNFAKSEDFYLRALEYKTVLFDKNPEAYRSDIAGIENNLGALYKSIRNYSQSEYFYLKALANKQILFEQNPRTYRKTLSLTLDNLGEVYSYLEDYDKSRDYYLQALNHRKILFEQDSSYMKELMHSLNNLGNYHMRKEEYAEAEPFYLDALFYIQKLFAVSPETYRKELASIQSNLGMLYTSAQDFENGVRYLSLAKDNVKILYDGNSNTYLFDWGHINNNLSIYYFDKNDLEESLIYGEVALEAYEKLYRIKASAYGKSLRVLLNRLSGTAKTMTRYSDALTYIDRAIAISPDSVYLYYNRGLILLKKDDLQGAYEMWKKILELDSDYLKGNENGAELYDGLKKAGLIR